MFMPYHEPMRQPPDRDTPSECEIKFHINPNLRPDKQKKRNDKFISWLMEAHPLAFKQCKAESSGMLYRIKLEKTLEMWIINKLDELKHIHHFDYNIYTDRPTVYDECCTYDGKAIIQ